LGWRVRVNESGLYCSEMTRSTAPLEGSTSTIPALRSFGELGKVVMMLHPPHMQLRPWPFDLAQNTSKSITSLGK